MPPPKNRGLALEDVFAFMLREYGFSPLDMKDVPMEFCLNRLCERAETQQKAQEIKNKIALMELQNKKVKR